jgi:hypothetical protein
MKFMTTWKALPGARKEAVERFLAGQGVPPEGVTVLERWHNTDCSGGYTLTESSNPQALFESAARWADLLEFHSHLVVEDAEAGPVLVKMAKK